MGRTIELLLLLFVAVVAVWDGAQVVSRNTDVAGAREGGGWVIILGLLLAVLVSIYWFQSRRSQGAAQGRSWRDEKGIHWVPIGFALLASYVFLIGYAGYVLATVLFLTIYLRVFGSYRWVAVLLGAIATSVGSTYFWSALGVLLPAGIFPRL